MSGFRDQALIRCSALLGLAAVAAGAFGAHAVSDPGPKAWLQTGGEYGMIHALAAIAAVGVSRLGAPRASVAAWCFLIGGALFSGSLYVLAVTHIPWLGAITPFGGLFMLAGWGLLAWTGFSLKLDNKP